jgi:hypothetical protein
VDVVAAGDVADRLAVLPPLPGLVLLVRDELRAASELHAALFRPFAAFRRTLADKVALELILMRSSA